MRNMRPACKDFLSVMKITLSGRKVFVSHNVHETVNIYSPIFSVLIYTIVSCKIVSEFMGRQFKIKARGRFGYHMLHSVSG